MISDMEQKEISASQIVYDQLGGKRFMVKVGAKKMIQGNTTLSFDVKKNPKDVTHVHIIIVFPDIYDVEFLKRYDYETEILSASYNVCAEDLHKIIEEGTGLEIHL